MTEEMYEKYDAILRLVKAGYPLDRAMRMNGIIFDAKDHHQELFACLEHDAQPERGEPIRSRGTRD